MSDLEESRIWWRSFEVFSNSSGFLPLHRKRVITLYVDLEFWESLCNDPLFHFSKRFQDKILHYCSLWNERSDQFEIKYCYWVPSWILYQAIKSLLDNSGLKCLNFPWNKLPNTSCHCFQKPCRKQLEIVLYFNC